MEENKKMNIAEFREKGYLQELNRRFLHPLGLALEITMDGDNERISGVWDHRNDKEGIFFDVANSEDERKIRFLERKMFIDSELNSRLKEREGILGFGIEPIN